MEYLYILLIISLCEAWYKVRRLANFFKIDRDSWHSLATPTILSGCREGIPSRSPIVDPSWLSIDIVVLHIWLSIVQHPHQLRPTSPIKLVRSIDLDRRSVLDAIRWTIAE